MILRLDTLKDRTDHEADSCLELQQARASIRKALEWADDLQEQLDERLQQQKLSCTDVAQLNQNSSASLDCTQSSGKSNRGSPTRGGLFALRPQTPEALVAARTHWLKKHKRRRALAAACLQRLEATMAEAVIVHEEESTDLDVEGVQEDREPAVSVAGSDTGSEWSYGEEEINAAVQKATDVVCVFLHIKHTSATLRAA
jgi:hypothetical protein